MMGWLTRVGFTATAVFSTQFLSADCKLRKQGFGAAVVASGAKCHSNAKKNLRANRGNTDRENWTVSSCTG